MPAVALAFALAAAVFHAAWNLLLARAPHVEAATAVALVTAEIVFAPVAVVVWHVDGRVWPWLVASGAFELVYFALLATAYRKAPLSVVYPVARGGAPVVVLLVTWSVAGRQAIGVLLVAAGVLLVRGVRHPDRVGLAFGAAIACCIAGYTLVDKHGIAYANPVTYLELSMLVPTVAYAGAVARTTDLRRAVTPASVVAGIATFVAYGFVLAALERAPAASVAAVRETSVVVAAILAVVVLKEPFRVSRLAGAAVVVAGVALLR
ncbi:MAG TPA: EamA family transporter [Gaiellaceae bacterium]